MAIGLRLTDQGKISYVFLATGRFLSRNFCKAAIVSARVWDIRAAD